MSEFYSRVPRTLKGRGEREENRGGVKRCHTYLDEKQRHSHDPGQLLVRASNLNVGARIDDRVFWPKFWRYVTVLFL